MRVLEYFLDLIAPRRCPACDRASASWCGECGTPAEPAAATIGETPVFAGGAYEGCLTKAIQRFKYQQRPDLARPLARLIVMRSAVGLSERGAVFVPVPLHFSRLVERGFNQSALVARELARSTRGRVLPRLLARVRETGRQAELDRAARLENMREAFRVTERPLPPAAFVVDDVITTGATAHACVLALERAGVRVLGICAVARADRARGAENPSAAAAQFTR